MDVGLTTLNEKDIANYLATAQALVGFVAKTLRRSQRYPLLLAVYVGSALGLISLIVRLSWPVTADGASGADESWLHHVDRSGAGHGRALAAL